MLLKAVLFDLDDTLFDHQHCTRSALAALYEQQTAFHVISLKELERQHSERLEHYHLRLLSGEMTLDQARLARFTDLLRRYDEDVTQPVIEQTETLYRTTYAASGRVVPGAVALLERLRAEGLRIGVLTNHTVAEQTGKLNRLGLTDLIDSLVISEAEGIAKPDPRIFSRALDRLGCQADEAVMVGDSWSSDIEGAHAAGIRAIWLNRYQYTCPNPTLAFEIQALDPLESVVQLIMSDAPSRRTQ